MTAYLDEELNKGAPDDTMIIVGISDARRARQTVENGTSVTVKWPIWVLYSNYSGTDISSESYMGAPAGALR